MLHPANDGGRVMIRADVLIEQLIALRAIVFDFDGVFTDNTVRIDQNGIESVTCWRSDGLGLKRIGDLNVKTLILSTEENPVVTVRANKLKTECIQGVSDKALALRAWASKNNLELGHVAYVGNDINDVSAFKVVGVPIAVADACPEVFPHVLHRTVNPGGHGAVREICDLIFHAKQGAPAGTSIHVL